MGPVGVGTVGVVSVTLGVTCGMRTVVRVRDRRFRSSGAVAVLVPEPRVLAPTAVPAELARDACVVQLLGAVECMPFRTVASAQLDRACAYRDYARTAIVSVAKARDLADLYRQDRDKHARELHAARAEIEMWRHRVSEEGECGERAAVKRRGGDPWYVPEYGLVERTGQPAASGRGAEEVIARSGGGTTGTDAYGGYGAGGATQSGYDGAGSGALVETEGSCAVWPEERARLRRQR